MKADWKPGTLLALVPVVMVSMADAAGKANILTVAWTGIVSSDPVKVYISVRPERYSYHILKETGEFVINAVTAELARACDYCGMVTGKKVDKFAKCGLTKEPSKVVRPPRIGESPLALECRVTDVQDHGVHHMFLADVVNVAVEDRCMDENGFLDLTRAGLVCYAHGQYMAVGDAIGKFGFSVKKDEAKGKKK